MGLAAAKKAKVSKTKVAGYLLSLTHPAGRTKAMFFRKHGFTPEKWCTLAEALRLHALRGHVTTTESTQYGLRCVVDGILNAPDGASLNVRSVWFITEHTSVPRFATAHPLKRKAL